jgi:hypothetical protein
MRTIDKIVTAVNCKFGSPMGRNNVGNKDTVSTKIFDCAVPMSSCGAYDSKGAYWGIGRQLRVRYTKDLNFVQFYRRGDL